MGKEREEAEGREGKGGGVKLEKEASSAEVSIDEVLGLGVSELGAATTTKGTEVFFGSVCVSQEESERGERERPCPSDEGISLVPT